MTRDELLEKAWEYRDKYIYNTNDDRHISEVMADFHLEMMKLEDKTVCPKCGSDNDNVVITIYCNNCGETY